MLTLDQARANRLHTDWDNIAIPVPWFLGRRNVTASLDELLPLLRLPADRVDDARPMIGMLRLRPPKVRGVYGFWAAQSVGDDIVAYKDDARASELARFHTLRQQGEQANGVPNLALADFVAPRDSLAPDYIGAFALSVDVGAEELVRSTGADERATAVPLTSLLAARLADAFAEHLHRRVREDWGYGEGEDLSRDDIAASKYRGLRVVPGSPAMPDVSEYATLLRLVHAADIDVSWDDGLGVRPEAALGGLYFSHERAKAFAVGAVGRDQFDDYAARKGSDPKSWLSWTASPRGAHA